MSKYAPKSDYSALLRDPRWQKRRLEIMQRDEFQCTSCFANEFTLNVHHRYYLKDKMPWEYEDRALITLCENCHKIETEDMKKNKERLFIALSHWGFLSQQIEEIAIAFETSPPLHYSHEPSATLVAFAIANEECREVVSDLFWSDIRKTVNRERGD